MNSCSLLFRTDVRLVLVGRGTGMITEEELGRLLQEHPSPMMTLKQLIGAAYKLKFHVNVLKPIHFYDPANADSGLNQLLKWLTEPQRVGVYIVVPKESNRSSTHAVVFDCDGEDLEALLCTNMFAVVNPSDSSDLELHDWLTRSTFARLHSRARIFSCRRTCARQLSTSWPLRPRTQRVNAGKA